MKGNSLTSGKFGIPLRELCRGKLLEKSFLGRFGAPFFQKKGHSAISRSFPSDGLKVLHLLVNLEMGGAERLLVDALPLLSRDKYRVEVLGLGSDGIVGAMLRSKGIPASALGGSKTDPKFIFKLINYLTKNKPHILHTHLFIPGVVGRVVGTAVGVKLIISHEHFQKGEIHPLRIVVEKNTWRLADAVVFVSHKLETERVANLPRSLKKFVIYNGINPAEIIRGERNNARHILGGKNTDVIIGWVGRINEHEKNLTLMLKAIKKIYSAQENIRVVLIGDGKDSNKLKTTTKEWGLSGVVQWLGARSDVRSLYSGMDVFVLPSRFEGMPLVLLEAMSAGLPVVASRVGGISEIVVDGETGFLVEWDDDKTLAERISLLAGNAKLRKQMGEKGKELFERQFRIERFVEKIDELYHGLWTGEL